MTTEHNPAAELYAALAKAQGAFQPIVKNREVQITMKTGGSYRFRYADLEEITAKTRPALSINGLAMIQTIEHGQNGPLLVCRLMHAGGGMVASEVSMPGVRDMGDPKSFGAAITYLRRYMVTAMLGVAADDDLDEDGQEIDTPPARTIGKPNVTQPQRRADSPSAPPAAETGDTSGCTAGELAYITKKIAGKGWTITQARTAAGLDAGDTLDGLTKAGFAALKAVA